MLRFKITGTGIKIWSFQIQIISKRGDYPSIGGFSFWRSCLPEKWDAQIQCSFRLLVLEKLFTTFEKKRQHHQYLFNTIKFIRLHLTWWKIIMTSHALKKLISFKASSIVSIVIKKIMLVHFISWLCYILALIFYGFIEIKKKILRHWII